MLTVKRISVEYSDGVIHEFDLGEQSECNVSLVAGTNDVTAPEDKSERLELNRKRTLDVHAEWYDHS